MAYATRLPRRDATRLPRREPTVQLRTDPGLRIRPQFKLPDWLLLASWSFGGLFSSFPTPAVCPRGDDISSFLAADQRTAAYLFNYFFMKGMSENRATKARLHNFVIYYDSLAVHDGRSSFMGPDHWRVEGRSRSLDRSRWKIGLKIQTSG